MAELKKLGRYELRRVLGKGAMGVVYEGYDPTLGRRVAVKTILKSLAHDEETERDYAERFVREAKAVARLNHPNITQVFDFGVENDVAYLVMEFIEGREMRSYFEAKEKFDTGEAVRIMGELLDALEFAHESNVIHRDVKPANVMLDARRRVKLADFGVARIQDSERSAAGTMVGTPAYMSPEQIQGHKIDRRTDIFSAGTILYQLLTGEQPFKAGGAWTVARQIIQDDPPLPSTLAVSVSPVFDGIVQRALAKNPHERFANAREFAAALRDAAAGKQPATVPFAAATPKRVAAAPGTSEAEVEFWRSIQHSGDPHEFEFYLRKFPDGMYSELAQHKLAKLREPIEAARKLAEEKARQEAEAARKAAEEEKARQAQALAKQRQQQEAAARAKAQAAEDATVPFSAAKPAAPPPAPAARKVSLAIPLAAAIVVIAGAAGAYFAIGRKPAPAPVAVAPPAPKAEAPPPAPPKVEVSAADIERIRRETEERIRREFADKSAAEQAAAAKAATEKAMQQKLQAMKAAQEKAAHEKAAAEKAQLAKAAAEKSAAARAAEEKAAMQKAAAERAAAERAAADKAAAEKLAAEKAAAEKAAARKPDASSDEAKLERFIQLKGRDKVLKQEPPSFGSMFHGQVLYVNDGTCGPGRIKEVVGGPTGDMRTEGLRETRRLRCIPLE